MIIIDRSYDEGGTQYVNLLEVTEFYLKVCDLTWDDIDWIGTSDGFEIISIEKFKELAKHEYNSIDLDLIIMFNNKSWFEVDYFHNKSEYLWRLTYTRKPKIQEFHKELTKVGR